jgi:hypothetical protein
LLAEFGVMLGDPCVEEYQHPTGLLGRSWRPCEERCQIAIPRRKSTSRELHAMGEFEVDRALDHVGNASLETSGQRPI